MCDTVIHENEGHYPELREKQAYITKVIQSEEENFAKTIDGGLKIFADMLAEHKAKGESVFSGADAFKLYDTYGFPIDLTLEMAEDEGLSVDQDAFQQLMEEQRVRARKAREALGDLGWAGIEFGKDMPETKFVGYDPEHAPRARCWLWSLRMSMQDDHRCRRRGHRGAGSDPVLRRDGRSGGRPRHHHLPATAVFEVTNVQKNKGGKYMHYGVVKSGSFSVGNTVIAAIDVKRRKAICRSHSATHLLQKALQHRAGRPCPSGRLPERSPTACALTLPISLPLPPRSCSSIERMVNHAVLAGGEVVTDVMRIDDAKKLGAMALFGEKYGDTVRVVRMKDENDQDYSMEFCGGTHVANTAMVGAFHIKSEGSVASGVRRIEATTGRESLRTMTDMEHEVQDVAAMLKVKPAELAGRVEAALSEIRDLRHAVERYKDREMLGEADRYLLSAKNVGGMKVLTATLNDTGADALRKIGDFLRDKERRRGGCSEQHATARRSRFLAVCGKAAVKAGIKAGEIITECH